MRLSDFVVEYLKTKNIKNFFVVTGRGTLFLNDSLARAKDLKTYFLHHEQSASFAAITTPLINNSISCCMISTGCASTNTITGVLSAWQDGIPCLFISGQNFLKETTNYTKKNIRTYGQQEADIIKIIKPITKYSTMVKNSSHIKFELDKAIFLANEGRKGPVWIDIPLDIQNSRIDEKKLKSFKKKKIAKYNNEEKINKVRRLISSSERPAVLIGSGIKFSNAKKELKRFVNKWKLPVVYTSSSSDIFGSKNKLSIGSIGSQGCSRAGAFTVQNSDLLLVLSSRLNSLTTGLDFKKFARDAKVIVVDIDKNEHSKKGIKKDLFIKSDVKDFLKKINKRNPNVKWIRWLKKCIEWKKNFKKVKVNNNEKGIDLYEISKILSDTMQNDTVFICDSGFIDVIMPTNIEFSEKQTCIHPVSQGSMGFALPAIVGAHALNKKNIISVIGDGSTMMNLQEFQTIKYYNIPVKIFIINNNVYGIIRKRQKELFRGRSIGTYKLDGLSCPDFRKVAKSFDISYKKITNNKNLKKDISKILKSKKANICEIIGKENQRYIEISYAKNKFGKIVRRPLEDQKPFLNRKLFLKEMIIKPIDQ